MSAMLTGTQCASSPAKYAHAQDRGPGRAQLLAHDAGLVRR
jgi:hypothetical protein